MRLSAKIVVGVRPRLGRRPGGGLFRLGKPIGPDAPVPFYSRNKLGGLLAAFDQAVLAETIESQGAPQPPAQPHVAKTAGALQANLVQPHRRRSFVLDSCRNEA